MADLEFELLPMLGLHTPTPVMDLGEGVTSGIPPKAPFVFCGED